MNESWRKADPQRSAAVVLSFVTSTGMVWSMGCVTPRPVRTEEEFRVHARADAEDSARIFDQVIGKMMDRTAVEADENATLNILAMSGGGDRGAFGAGFLVGWGQVQDPEFRRPDFDIVTGVSTGALLAPFAFLGTDEACLAIETLYRNPKHDWVRSRGPLFFWPSNSSFFELPGLERELREAISPEFIGTLAERSRDGRALIITATDLDLGRQKAWDLGAEAERAVDAGGVDRVQRMLLASSAIPALFPPVMIEDSVYADGGVTANVFLRLEPHDPRSFISRWRRERPDRPLPKTRYWIVVNNQMHQPPETVQIRWPSVISPSLATAVRSATIAELRWLAAEVDYVNATLGTDIEVRVVAIPDDWRPPVVGEFREETMRSLTELGRRLGEDPSSWTIWASPRRGLPAVDAARHEP